MKLKPIGNHIVVRREPTEDKTAGGIILPDNAKKKTYRGEVVATGNGKLNRKDGSYQPMQVEVGNTILFSQWAGEEYKTADGDELLIMTEDEVLAVIG